MKMITEIIEKDKYRSTSSGPTIYKLLIDCEGTYDEINLFQNKLDKFIDNGMKTNYTQQIQFPALADDVIKGLTDKPPEDK